MSVTSLYSGFSDNSAAILDMIRVLTKENELSWEKTSSAGAFESLLRDRDDCAAEQSVVRLRIEVEHPFGEGRTTKVSFIPGKLHGEEFDAEDVGIVSSVSGVSDLYNEVSLQVSDSEKMRLSQAIWTAEDLVRGLLEGEIARLRLDG